MIRSSRDAFPAYSFVRRNHQLVRIDDAKELGETDSRNCVMATMAAQIDMGNGTFINLDERLFDHPKHSRLSRAILLLHEFIYSTARNSFHHRDSAATRELIGLMISEGISIGETDRIRLELGFGDARYNGAEVLFEKWSESLEHRYYEIIGVRCLAYYRSELEPLVLNFPLIGKESAHRLDAAYIARISDGGFQPYEEDQRRIVKEFLAQPVPVF